MYGIKSRIMAVLYLTAEQDLSRGQEAKGKEKVRRSLVNQTVVIKE